MTPDTVQFITTAATGLFTGIVITSMLWSRSDMRHREAARHMRDDCAHLSRHLSKVCDSVDEITATMEADIATAHELLRTVHMPLWHQAVAQWNQRPHVRRALKRQSTQEART